MEKWKNGEIPEGFYEVLSGNTQDLYRATESLGWFHPKEVYMHEELDEYAYGLRADHFVVTKGFSEAYENAECVLVMANHKGVLYFKYFTTDKDGVFDALTPKQRNVIRKIERTLDIKCEAKSVGEAKEFIGKYLDESLEKKNGDSL